MAEYIDRETITKQLKSTIINPQTAFINNILIGLLEKAPLCDVVEVRHGEWLPSRNGINPIRCDKCNTPALFVQEQDGFGGYGFYRCPSNFCPNCGAKMDRERKPKETVSLVDGHIDKSNRCVSCGTEIPEVLGLALLVIGGGSDEMQHQTA